MCRDSRKLAVKELAGLMDGTDGGQRSFDEARVELVRRQMERNGIDPDTGLPLHEKLGMTPAARDSALRQNKSWGPVSSLSPFRFRFLRFLSS